MNGRGRFLRLAVLTLMGAGMLLAGSGPAFAHSGSHHVPFRWVRDGTIGWSYTSSVPTAVRTRVLDGLAPWNSRWPSSSSESPTAPISTR